MLLKIIPMPSEQTAFLLRTGKSLFPDFIPMKAVPTYLLAPETQDHYASQRWCRRHYEDLKGLNDIFNTHEEIKDPLHYLRIGQGFMSVFLPQNSEDARVMPFGMNFIEPHQDGHLYIAQIEGFNDTLYPGIRRASIGKGKGIGRATIAQAIGYYKRLYPNAQKKDIALSIVPENNDKDLITLYRSYGFDMMIDGEMYMSFKNALTFMNRYNKNRWYVHVPYGKAKKLLKEKAMELKIALTRDIP